MTAEIDAWDWLVDALVEELSAARQPDRQAILRHLVIRAGYACADAGLDPATATANARADLVQRLVTRVREAEVAAVTAPVPPVSGRAKIWVWRDGRRIYPDGEHPGSTRSGCEGGDCAPKGW